MPLTGAPRNKFCRDKVDLVRGCVAPAGFEPGSPDLQFQNCVAMSRSTNWPPKLSTNMVIDHCTLSIQPCMIHFYVRSNILVNIMYHTFVYVEHTWSYNHFSSYISTAGTDGQIQWVPSEWDLATRSGIFRPWNYIFLAFLLTILTKSTETQ